MRGNKKAVVVGINYPGTRSELRGCGTDANNFRQLLESEGYSVVVLSDSPKNFPSSVKLISPTRNNIMNEFSKLIEGSRSGDQIVFACSSHGTQKSAQAGSTELDGKKECLVPSDNSLIVDEELKIILDNLAGGASFLGITDGCHTGSIFNFSEDLDPQTRSLIKRYAGVSGCQDRQTSADAFLDGVFQGALSASLLAWVKKNSFDKMLSILLSDSIDEKRAFQKELIVWLKERNFEQKPNISFEIPGVSINSLPAKKPTKIPSPSHSTQNSPVTASPTLPSPTPSNIGYPQQPTVFSSGTNQVPFGYYTNYAGLYNRPPIYYPYNFSYGYSPAYYRSGPAPVQRAAPTQVATSPVRVLCMAPAARLSFFTGNNQIPQVSPRFTQAEIPRI